MSRPVHYCRIAFACFAVVVGIATLPAVSSADEAGCNADKLKSLSTTLSRLLRCSAKTILSADPPDPDCIADADARLAARFTAAESDPGCASSGEASEIRLAMHALEAELRDLLVVTSDGRRCAAGKMRVATKRATKELKCRQRGALTADPPDPDCLANARHALTEGFAYREAHSACDTIGDAPAIENLTAGFLAYASSKIDGTFDEPSPTGLSASVSGSAVELEWTEAVGDPSFSHSRVLRRLNAAVTGPADPSASLVFLGDAVAAFDDLTALLPDTTTVARTYHYAVYACDSIGNCESGGSHTTLTPTVRQALVAGGYVIHWRHADADVCSDKLSLGTAGATSYPDWWKRCDADCPTPSTGTATARQLNARGRADAAMIGAAFDTLGITVGRVLTSEYCRNVETAQHMDFGPPIEEVQELTYWVYDEASRCADTFVMLGEAPAAGTNTALIGHAGNACSPLSDLVWGEAAIYKPDGMGGATFIQRVLETGWLSLP